MKRSISATRLAWLRARASRERAPRLALDEEVIVVARIDVDVAARPGRRSPSPCGSGSSGRGRRAPRCRRTRRGSSRASRATRGRGGWSARRAAGDPGRSSSRRASAARMRQPPENSRERPVDLVGLEAEPAEDHLGLRPRAGSRRAPRSGAGPRRSGRAAPGRPRGAAMRGGEPLELGLEAPDLVEARQRLGQDRRAPRCPRPPAADSRRSRRCRGARGPASGSSTPARMRQSVVLPAPFGPDEADALAPADAPRTAR